ncbi:MAG TPA: hypothetical protein VG982_02460 [Candidatus Paceibacterota bacterium]|jgi:hypothetical protein|nr:hypothetical protein [Candidatus Paceibacterota bacterium]
MKYSLNKTLVYFLIFTVIGSLVAYKLIIKGYNQFLDTNTYASELH